MPRGRPRQGLSLRIHKASGVWYAVNPDTRREHYFTRDRDQSQALFEQWLLDRARQAERESIAPQEPEWPVAAPGEGDLIITTVADAFNLYLEWLHQRKKFRSYHIARGISREFGEYIPLQTRLDSLTKKDFRTYRDALWKKVAKENLKRSHANRRFRIVRAAFRRAYRESDEMINGEKVCAMLSVFEVRQEKDAEGARPITPEEFRAIAEADDEQWKAIMYLAMNCALGNTDIARLERRHVNLGDAMLVFSRPKAEETADRPRRTPLWPETVNTLKTHLTSSRSQRLLFSTVRGNAWVRCTDRGINDELAKKFRKIARQLEITRPGLSFYSIRHAAAEWAADIPGVGEIGVKFLLGHATPEMWGRYVTKTPARLQKAVQASHHQVFSGQDDQVSTVDDLATASEG